MLNVIILGITSFLTDISSEMIYPILPLYLTISLGATPTILGLIEGIAESISSLLKVISGNISDSLRRRKPLTIFGYSCSAFGKLILYLSISWCWVFAARIIDRFGKGIRTAPRDALISDSTETKIRGKAFGIHRALDTFGAAAGILIAYFLLTAVKGNYKSVFIFSLIPALLGVTVIFLTKEKINRKSGIDVTSQCHCEPAAERRAKQSDNKKSVAQGFSLDKSVAQHNAFIYTLRNLDSKLKAFLIISFIFTLGNSSNMFILLKAKTVGFASETILLGYFLYNVVYALSSFPAGIISDKISRKTLIVLGYFIYGVVYFLFAITNNISVMWILFVIYGLYTGITESIEKAFISVISPQERKATLLGLHSTIVGLGLFPASFIAGILWTKISPQATFLVGSATGIFSTIAFLIFI